LRVTQKTIGKEREDNSQRATNNAAPHATLGLRGENVEYVVARLNSAHMSRCGATDYVPLYVARAAATALAVPPVLRLR
jgi:hypothetical protein